MLVAKLIKRDREQIIELLEKGEDLPWDYKHILFPPEKKNMNLCMREKSGKKIF